MQYLFNLKNIMQAYHFDRTKAVESVARFPLGTRPFEMVERSREPTHEAARVRIEAMLAKYPAQDLPALLSRLRIPQVAPANDAFFELYVLDLFLDSGYRLLGVEQALPHTTYLVDFTFESPDGQPLLVEVACFNPPRESVGIEKRLNEVYNALDSIVSERYQLEIVGVSGLPQESVRRRSVREQVERWLDSMVTDEEQQSARKFRFVPGFELTLKPHRRNAQGRPGLLTSVPKTMYNHDVIDGIRRKLYKKAYKYGPLPMPLVLALNVAAELEVSSDVLYEAIYGEASRDVSGGAPLVFPGEYVPMAGALLEAGGPLSTIPAVVGFRGVSPFDLSRSIGAVYYGKYASPLSLAPLRLRTYDPPGQSVIRESTPGGANGLE